MSPKTLVISLVLLITSQTLFSQEQPEAVTPEELEEVKRILHPIKLTYIIHKNKRSIGKKRNELIKACNTKIFCF